MFVHQLKAARVQIQGEQGNDLRLSKNLAYASKRFGKDDHHIPANKAYDFFFVLLSVLK